MNLFDFVTNGFNPVIPIAFDALPWYNNFIKIPKKRPFSASLILNISGKELFSWVCFLPFPFHVIFCGNLPLCLFLFF